MVRRTLNGLPNAEFQLHHLLDDWNRRRRAWISRVDKWTHSWSGYTSTASDEGRLEVHGSWKRDGVRSIGSVLRRCNGERGVDES